MVVCTMLYGIAMKMVGMKHDMTRETDSRFYKWLKANFIFSCHKKYHPLFEELINNMPEDTYNGFYDQFKRWENNTLGIYKTPQYAQVKAIMNKL